MRSARNETPSKTESGAPRGGVRPAVWTLGLSLGLFALLVEPAAQAPAPSPLSADTVAPGQRVVRTPDGSRFLLHPTGGPGVVFWVVLSPAGPREDREGLEGLAAAVARASMSGTTRVGSRNRATENDLLARVEEHERRTAVLRRAGQSIPDELLNDLRQDASQADAIADRLAWERALRLAPADGSRLIARHDAVMLQLALPVESVHRVASLLAVRREEPVLRGVHDELRAVRLDSVRSAAAEPWSAVRDEVRALAYRAHPYARAALVDAFNHEPLTRAEALAVFRQTQRPDRVVHVLTGGFDPDAIVGQLNRAFATTALTAEPVPTERPAGLLRGERTSQVEAGRQAGLAIAYQPPPGSDHDAVAVLAEWLAGGEESYLARALFARGLRAADVRCTYPFPGLHAPLLLVEVQAELQDARDPTRLRRLFAEVDGALADVARVSPTAEELTVARGRLAAERSRGGSGPDVLAVLLAERWGLFGMSPAQAVRSVDAVTDAEVVALSKQTVVGDRRVRVTQERAP